MTHVTRRCFMTSFAAAAVSLPLARNALGQHVHEIEATTRVIEVKGKAATVFSLASRNGFVFDAAQDLHLMFANGLREPTLVHWHGQTPPSDQDGVPMLSRAALMPGES